MPASFIAHTGPTLLTRTARLSIFGFIGWFSFLLGNQSTRAVALFVAALVLAAIVGISWYAFRARADRRLRRALDRYGEQDQAQTALPRRNPHARLHSKAGWTTGVPEL
jgi:hypothetical protein